MGPIIERWDVKRIVRFRASLLAGMLAFCLAPGVATAEDSISNEAGVGALSALSSLVYGPVNKETNVDAHVLLPESHK